MTREPRGRLTAPDTLDTIGLVLRVVLGAVMLVAGGLKVDNLAESRAATRAYDLLPVELANFVGGLLPFAEVALGILLLLGLLTRGAAVVTGVLMVAFIVGVGSAWARGLTIDCGCFGGGGQVGSNDTRYLQEIVRDVALALCAAWLVWRPSTRWSLDRRLWGTPSR